MEDQIQLRGCFKIVLQNAYNGEVVDERIVNNTVVLGGRKWALQQLESTDMATAQSISHMAIGTGTAAPVTSDSALGGESSRVAIGTIANTNLTSNPPSIVMQASWATNQGNTTLGEAGLFNSSAAGTMFSRGTFATLNKTTSNTLTISYAVSG